MKKILKIVIIAAALMMETATSMQAQVFIMENEHNLREDDPEIINSWPANPQNGNGAGTDDYVPVGNGLVCLSVLGGVYLFGKKKKQS